MELKIRETAWGINRVAGGYREKVTADVSFPCAVGNIPDFGTGKRSFTIDEVNENSIVISVHCADSRYDKTLTIKKGKEITYRPHSFDGGYFYQFKLI